MELAFEAEHNLHPAATFLRSEVHRAIVVDEIDAADEIVQLNNGVSYQLDKQPVAARVLVHPGDYAGSELHLSVLTSLGAALIGVRVGEAMPFMCTEGNLHIVRPLAVRRQPGLSRHVKRNLSEDGIAVCCRPNTRISDHLDGAPRSEAPH
jgi:transcription elongation GreA/GreB family factor